MARSHRSIARRGDRSGRTGSVLLALAGLAATVLTTGVHPAPAAAAAPAPAARSVTAPWSLAAGEALTSPGGSYALVMQADGNLVEHLVAGSSTILLWNTTTWGHAGAHAELGADGILRVLDTGGGTLWQDPGPAAPAAGQPARLQLGDDGRLVTTTSTGSPLWSNLTFGSRLEGGSGALGPGQHLESSLGLRGSPAHYTVEMQADGNLVEYSDGTRFGRHALWSARTYGHPGAYARLTKDGHLQVVDPSGSILYASTNPPSPTDQQPARMALSDDSRLVIGTSKGFPLWTSISFGHSLPAGATLYPGQRFSSTDGTLSAGMSSDGAFMVWNASGKAVWAMSSRRWVGASATMQADGNLVVRDAAGNAVWSSRSSGSGALATFSANGSLYVYRGTVALATIYRGLRDTIVARAMSWVGYTVANHCNAFSAYWGDGVPCNGGRSEAWCADFAAWAWATSGVTGLHYPNGPNGFPISWRTWAEANGRWHPAGSGYRVRAGDAVVYGLDIPDRLGHVAIATGNLTNGYPDTINGDFGGYTTKVEFVRGLRISDHADPRTVIAGYITPS